MPSNDSPAFDVLSADENDLWEWAVKRAGAENAATYIRDETLKAALDTDLARARVEGAREIREAISELRHGADVIDAYSEPSPGWTNVQAKRCREVADNLARAIPLPAPRPAECRLSDGHPVNDARDDAPPAPNASVVQDAVNVLWRSGFKFLSHSLESEFAQLLAATRTEGTDGR